jgi:hypothetical protein
MLPPPSEWWYPTTTLHSATTQISTRKVEGTEFLTLLSDGNRAITDFYLQCVSSKANEYTSPEISARGQIKEDEMGGERHEQGEMNA